MDPLRRDLHNAAKTSRSLDDAKRAADYQTKKFQEHSDSILEKMNLVQDGKVVNRNANRTLRNAQNALRKVKHYINEEEALEMDNFSGGEEDEEESAAVGDAEVGEEDEEPEQRRKTSVRTILVYWKRLLEEISVILKNKFHNLFNEVDGFIDQFKKEEADIQQQLDTKWQESEINKILRTGNRLLEQLKNALQRKNPRSSELTKQKLEKQVAILKTFFTSNGELNNAIGNEQHTISGQLRDTMTSFIQEAEETIHQFDSILHGSNNNNTVKKKAERAGIEDYKRSIINLRLDIERTRRQLEAELDNQLQKAKKEADDTNDAFLRSRNENSK